MIPKLVDHQTNYVWRTTINQIISGTDDLSGAIDNLSGAIDNLSGEYLSTSIISGYSGGGYSGGVVFRQPVVSDLNIDLGNALLFGNPGDTSNTIYLNQKEYYDGPTLVADTVHIELSARGYPGGVTPGKVTSTAELVRTSCVSADIFAAKRVNINNSFYIEHDGQVYSHAPVNIQYGIYVKSGSAVFDVDDFIVSAGSINITPNNAYYGGSYFSIDDLGIDTDLRVLFNNFVHFNESAVFFSGAALMDNSHLQLGNGEDADIYYNGTDLSIGVNGGLVLSATSGVTFNSDVELGLNVLNMGPARIYFDGSNLNFYPDGYYVLQAQLPTTSGGTLPTGGLWRDGNIVKVKL